MTRTSGPSLETVTDREPLTASQVRYMVDSAGIDLGDLEIETEAWEDARTGERIQGVLVGHGPSRGAVFQVLVANGLLVHPHDEDYAWVTNRPTPIQPLASAAD